MRLTAHTDYALRVLIYAAVQPDERCTIEQIAAGYGISRNHLMKIVRKLGEHGFIETVRGRGGGLRLARPAEEIVVGDVVRVMEEGFAQAECFKPAENRCVITPACGLIGVLKRAVDAYLGVLDEVTLAEISTRRDKLARLLALPDRD
ncbi:BadM/Rrf2 family transcriptional regulator [Marinicauda salina]|uniref:BadM/Rrf2 family transcriptional regulator n=1 Tax=Marinicauda salina TaxID=2135793 RepID=A0A2U2BVQ7_9PROT|nr:Rrf2 family transcriptional regulator [Marinicauda salina]PWE18077.1 BadM/Rrf2 family transcriptional regulator [Marinicauda salina]